MRIFIVTIEDPLYCPLFLKSVIDELRDNIVGISIISPFTKKTVSKGISQSLRGVIKSRFFYYGLIDFIKQSYFFIMYKILDKVPFCSGRRRFYSVRSIAKFYKLNLVHCNCANINDINYIDKLRRFNIDVIIYLIPQIAKKQFLESAKIGCLNTHCALLPKNRGREPLFWAMVNQEPFTGVTVHFMGEGIDNGPILKQQKIEIAPEDTLHTLYVKATTLGSKLMVEGIRDLEKGKRDFLKNDDSGTSYNDWPDGRAIKKFRKLGKHFR